MKAIMARKANNNGGVSVIWRAANGVKWLSKAYQSMAMSAISIIVSNKEINGVMALMQ